MGPGIHMDDTWHEPPTQTLLKCRAQMEEVSILSRACCPHKPIGMPHTVPPPI